MTSLVMKLFACPISLLIGNFFFQLNYRAWQAIIVGFILAVIFYILDLLILTKGTSWITTLSNFIAAYITVYLSQFFLRHVSIPLLNAAMAGVLLAAVDYIQHNYLIKTGKTKLTED